MEHSLRSTRLVLQKIVPTDLDDLVDLDSDPEVMRFISEGVPTPRSDYVGRDGLLARMCAYADEPYGYFSARFEDRFAGWFHLRPSVADGSMLELGYRLRREFWGLGLATEGARRLCDLAFDTLNQEAVDACAVAENRASIQVMKKCGMTPVGRFVHPRVPIEVERYLVRRGDYGRS
jgi:RimJ/RimL family protein N-acetyltransferase